MHHATPTLTLAIPDTLPPNLHPDAVLLALAPELQAAGRARLAYDRDLDATSRDPDHAAAMAESQALSDTVEAVAERIFALRPRTIAGLFVVAHAVALRAEDDWDDPLEDVGHDGVLLRHLANSLFGLVGIDWLGQPAARPKARPPVELREPALDAAITKMLTKPAGTAASESAVGPMNDSADPQLVAMVQEW